MLTLEELWDYYEKGYLKLRIDVFFPPDTSINFPGGLPDKIAKKLIKEKKQPYKLGTGLRSTA